MMVRSGMFVFWGDEGSERERQRIGKVQEDRAHESPTGCMHAYLYGQIRGNMR